MSKAKKHENYVSTSYTVVEIIRRINRFTFYSWTTTKSLKSFDYLSQAEWYLNYVRIIKGKSAHIVKETRQVQP